MAVAMSPRCWSCVSSPVSSSIVPGFSSWRLSSAFCTRSRSVRSISRNLFVSVALIRPFGSQLRVGPRSRPAEPGQLHNLVTRGVPGNEPHLAKPDSERGSEQLKDGIVGGPTLGGGRDAHLPRGAVSPGKPRFLRAGDDADAQTRRLHRASVLGR